MRKINSNFKVLSTNEISRCEEHSDEAIYALNQALEIAGAPARWSASPVERQPDSPLVRNGVIAMTCMDVLILRRTGSPRAVDRKLQSVTK